MAGTIQSLEEPSQVQAGNVAFAYRGRAFSHTCCCWDSSWVTVVGVSENQLVCMCVALPDWTNFAGWQCCTSTNWKRMKEIGVLPLPLSVSVFLNGMSWPGDSSVSPHLSALFSHLQLAPRCRTLQSTLWLTLVQPEFSHPKPCRSILKHYSICPLWSFFSFFFFHSCFWHHFLNAIFTELCSQIVFSAYDARRSLKWISALLLLCSACWW